MTACPERHEDLSALLDGALDPEAARALEEHLAGCPGCRAEREALAQVVEQVRGLPRRAAPPFFGAAVMARLLEDEQRPAPTDVVLLVEEPPPPAPATPTPHADPATAPTVPVPAPGTAPRGPDCALVAEDLSAYLDDELPPEDRRRVERHLGACPACDADLWVVDQQRARLRALPRVRPHELFVRQIMSKIEAEELAAADRGRRLAAQRAERVRRLGWVLRAASLLAAVALSLNLTAPERAPSSIPWPGPSIQAEPRASEVGALAAPAPAPVDQPPLAGPFDAVLELRAEQELERAFTAAQELVRSTGRLEATRTAEGQRELKVQVPARLVDDLYRDLDARPELAGSSEAARMADALAVEQDRVVLKSGVVLAGTIQSESPAAVLIVAGGLPQRVDRRRIERIERADQPRSVRLVITERP